MKEDTGPQKLGSFIFEKQEETKKPPAYQWQDLALEIIKELKVPNFKRSSVFKICKDNHKNEIQRALNDTRELCQKGDKWKYFFKVISDKKTSE